MYQCQCHRGSWCHVNGTCPFPGGCTPGFFGPGCQYRDLCYTQCARQVPSFVRDRDASTCNPDSSSMFLDITFNNDQIFDWFRITVNNDSSLLEFNVTVNDREACKNEKRLVVDPNIVDVVCDNTHLLSKITLTGPAVRHICTVNVSGGRNVAWRQFANQSSIYHDEDDPGDAFTAVSNLNYPTNPICSRTQAEANPYWLLTYNRPQIITQIRVLTRNDLFATLKNVVVTLRDKTLAVDILQSTPNVAASSYLFTSLKYLPVISLRVASRAAFRMCYVETLGETLCPEGTWGLGCEKECNCSISQTCSVVNGVCHALCPLGFYSYKCSYQCLDNCRPCLKQTGRCREECPRGKFGQLCSNVCPQGCLNNACEWSSGNCLACAPGRFGTSCTTQCPEDCLNNTCEFSSGQCQECQPGKFGVYCTDACPVTCPGDVCDKYTGDCTECKEGYYGPRCTQSCSRMCVEHRCNITSGACLACRNGQVPNCTACPKGKYGNDCNSSCPEFCRDGLCDVDIGYCFACVGNRQMPFCPDVFFSLDFPRYTERNRWFWLLIILLPLVALLAFAILSKMKPQVVHSESKE
ncbi:hypothetical protein BsWGS_18439 [Bradybaena similaris]